MTGAVLQVRVGPELLAFVDEVRGGDSRAAWLKGLIVAAREGWPHDVPGWEPIRLAEPDVVEPIRGPGPHHVIVDEVDPFLDHDSETRALVGERLPWQVDAERVSAQYRRDIEHLDRMIASAEPEPANPYLLP